MVDVFEEGRGDDVDGGLRFHLFDADVDDASEGGVFGLEQFGDGEEELGAFVFAEVFSLVEEVDEVGESADAFGAIELGLVEAAGIVHGAGLVDAYEGCLFFGVVGVG